MKKLDYLYNSKSEISNVCNVVEGHCHQAIKIVHHYADGCFDWLISGQQSVNPSREPISILSGKYKRFTFVHPVGSVPIRLACSDILKLQSKFLVISGKHTQDIKKYSNIHFLSYSHT